jgi:hypothetical protein
MERIVEFVEAFIPEPEKMSCRERPPALYSTFTSLGEEKRVRN